MKTNCKTINGLFLGLVISAAAATEFVIGECKAILCTNDTSNCNPGCCSPVLTVTPDSCYTTGCGVTIDATWDGTATRRATLYAKCGTGADDAILGNTCMEDFTCAGDPIPGDSKVTIHYDCSCGHSPLEIWIEICDTVGTCTGGNNLDDDVKGLTFHCDDC